MMKKDFIVYKCDPNVSGLTDLGLMVRSHKYNCPKGSDLGL